MPEIKDFLPTEFEVEELSAKVVASSSAQFAKWLRNSRFEKLFENRTGETKESIGLYRAKGKNPAYMVKAGVGIPGSLNYLAGLYRGKAKSKSGKEFSYAAPRDLLTDGWRIWHGEQKVKEAYELYLRKLSK